MELVNCSPKEHPGCCIWTDSVYPPPPIDKWFPANNKRQTVQTIKQGTENDSISNWSQLSESIYWFWEWKLNTGAPTWDVKIIAGRCRTLDSCLLHGGSFVRETGEIVANDSLLFHLLKGLFLVLILHRQKDGSIITCYINGSEIRPWRTVNTSDVLLSFTGWRADSEAETVNLDSTCQNCATAT